MLLVCYLFNRLVMCILMFFCRSLGLCCRLSRRMWSTRNWVNMMISVRYWVNMMVSLVKINWVLVGIGILVYDDLGFVMDSI